MRILHTADWHLGRLLSGERLIEDQCHVLAQIVGLVKEFRPHAVVIAGDVYDRPIPSPDAVELLDDVIAQVALECGTPVVIIAGNHDSAPRLSFGARVMARNRVHVFGDVRGGANRMVFEDEHGPVSLYAVPFLDTASASEQLGCELATHDAAMRAAVEQIGPVTPNERRLLVAHAFVAGCEVSDTERAISVGTASMVSADCFADFAYTALGHLHRAQNAGSARVRYAGSPLQYSFAEETHRKSVELVEIDAAGAVKAEAIALQPRRRVRTLAGNFEDLLHAKPEPERREDLIAVTLLDRYPVIDARQRLCEVYPNVLQVSQPEVRLGGVDRAAGAAAASLNDAELFASFFAQVMGEAMNEDEAAELKLVLEEAERAEREAIR